MNNTCLIKNWRSIGIQFNTSKETTSLFDLFLICIGETEIDVSGKKELVVTFYQGYDDKGSPAVFFTSDDEDRCWAYAHNNGTHIKSNVGYFVVDIPKQEDKKEK